MKRHSDVRENVPFSIEINVFFEILNPRSKRPYVQQNLAHLLIKYVI